jgi:hypothetical protein
VTLFYCLRFETSLFVASYESQGALRKLRNSAHLYRRGTATDLQKTHHVIAIQLLHCRSGWTYRKHVTWSLATVL